MDQFQSQIYLDRLWYFWIYQVLALKHLQDTQQGQLWVQSMKKQVFPREILKHGFWSKESKFEKLHDQVINTQDLIFSYLIWKALKRGLLNNDFHFQAWWGAKPVLDRAEILWNEI